MHAASSNVARREENEVGCSQRGWREEGGEGDAVRFESSVKGGPAPLSWSCLGEGGLPGLQERNSSKDTVREGRTAHRRTPPLDGAAREKVGYLEFAQRGCQRPRFGRGAVQGSIRGPVRGLRGLGDGWNWMPELADGDGIRFWDRAFGSGRAVSGERQRPTTYERTEPPYGRTATAPPRFRPAPPLVWPLPEIPGFGLPEIPGSILQKLLDG